MSPDFKLFLEIMDVLPSGLKTKRTVQIYQCQVQKPAFVMVWGCACAHAMGNLHIYEGTINAEKRGQ